MSHAKRATGLFGVVAVLLATLSWFATSASALTCATATDCVTIAPQNSPSFLARGAQATFASVVTVTGSPVTSAIVELTPAGGISLDPTSVRFAGTPIAATTTGTGLAIDLSAEVPLAAGNYAVTYSATMPSTSDTDGTVITSATYDNGSGPLTATAAAQQIRLTRPDQHLISPGSDPLAVPDGPGALITLTVANDGAAAITTSTLTVRVTPGFIVSGAAGNGFDCSPAAAVITCTVPSGTLLTGSITVSAASGTPAATTATVTATVALDDGPSDATPDDNTISIPVFATGTALIQATIDKGDATLHVGESITYVVTVTNTGPDPSTATELRILYPGGPGVVQLVIDGVDSAASGVFELGNLAVGQTVTKTVQITALVAQTDPATFMVTITSSSYDPYPCTPEGCELRAARQITLLAAAPTVVTSTTIGSKTSTDPELANTGAPTIPILFGGLLLTLIGLITTRAGRPTRT
ncbi:MAG: hypothetical protein JWM76_3910 [Pseudonocardiales bacterium]|nr:hypothetical protein [Pseudonocardiales bacterium]